MYVYEVEITKKRLTHFGLVSMLDYYTKKCICKLIKLPLAEPHEQRCRRLGNLLKLISSSFSYVLTEFELITCVMHKNKTNYDLLKFCDLDIP